MDKKLFRSYLLLIALGIFFVAIVVKFDDVIQIIKTILSILSPLFLGVAIAFILNRPFCFIKRILSKWIKFKKSEKLVNALSVLLVYCLFFGIITGIIAFIIPQLGESVSMLYANIDSYSATLNRLINEAAEFLKLQKIEISTIQQYLQNILKGAGDVVSFLFPQIFSFTSSLIQTLINLIVGFIISVYILADRDHLFRQMNRATYAYLKKPKADKAKKIGKLTADTFTNFIAGQATEAVILGVMCFIGMSLLGFEYALLSGTIIAVTSFIPIIGSIIGCIPTVFIFLMINPMKAVWFIVFIVLLQQIEGNLIYPKVVGESIGLPPLWVFLAVILGSGIGGILGMIIGVPAASVIYKLLSIDTRKRLSAQNNRLE